MCVRLVHKALRDDGGRRLDEGRLHRVYRGPRRKRGQRHRSTGRHCGSVLRSPLEHGVGSLDAGHWRHRDHVQEQADGGSDEEAGGVRR